MSFVFPSLKHFLLKQKSRSKSFLLLQRIITTELTKEKRRRTGDDALKQQQIKFLFLSVCLSPSTFKLCRSQYSMLWSQRVELLNTRVEQSPFCSLSHLEYKHILKFITDPTRTRMLHLDGSQRCRNKDIYAPRSDRGIIFGPFCCSTTFQETLRA